ncbi:fused MFS/spermidine synthase, partial [Agromyces seonyuensis]
MTGARIEFEADVFSSTGYTLVVDGAAQSHVDAIDPTHLFFEYARRIGNALDGLAPAGRAIRVLHLGGGGLTLLRYLAATRPGSRQVAVDVDADVVRAVLERMPLPAGEPVEVRVADARSEVARIGERFDAVVLDVYRGLDAPAFVDAPEFLGSCLGLLDPAEPGILVVNVADAAGGPRLAAQARGIARADPGAEVLAA